MTESFKTGFEKIDGCGVPSYSQLELNTLYYQDPAKIIPIIEMIINSPNTNKKSVNKIKKFKEIIKQNKTLNNSKVTFYLNKCASKLKNTRLTQTNIKVLNLNLESQSTLPYVFAQFKKPQLKTKGLAEFCSILIDSGSEVNLVSVEELGIIGLSTDKINHSQRYNIKSSTETVQDLYWEKLR